MAGTPASHLLPQELLVASSRPTSSTFSFAEEPGVRLDMNNKPIILISTPTEVGMRMLAGRREGRSARRVLLEVLQAVVTDSRHASGWHRDTSLGHLEDGGEN